jgi:hypothetical protein
MRKSLIAGLALCATLTGFAGKAQAYVNCPWCMIGDTRAVDCVFSSREQCSGSEESGFWRPVHAEPLLRPYKRSGH